MAEAINTDSAEIWKPIPGFEGAYEASSLGRIRSLSREIECERSGKVLRLPVAGKVLSSSVCKRTGYQKTWVSLIDGGRGKTVSVHKLVCLAFHGPRPSGKQCVAHGNGNRTDNRPENLRWATNLENAKDRALHGKSNGGRRRGLNPIAEAKYLQMFARWDAGEFGKDLAAELGVHKDTFYAAYRRINLRTKRYGRRQ